MPKPAKNRLISLRSFRLASTTGHVINVEANEPFDCPAKLLPEAFNAGCVPVDAKGQPAIGAARKAPVDRPPGPTPPEGDERVAAITQVMEAILTEGDPNKITSAGRPKTYVVQDAVGFSVSAAEVETIYTLLVDAD